MRHTVKINLKERRCEVAEWFKQAERRIQWVSFENGSEHSDFLEGREMLYYLSNYQLLKTEYVSWDVLT
jgi:hypothetical protein